MKALITASATMNDTTKPMAIRSQPTAILPDISASRLSMTSSVVAPSMVGTARKKLNSAAVRRSTPIARAPMIVAPDRLTPGIIETHWTTPMPSAVRTESCATPLGPPGLAVRSITRMAMPPRISAQATMDGLPSIAWIWSLSSRPSTAEGMKPSRILRTKAIDIGSSRNSPAATAQNVRQYSATTAMIAPSWMMTLNTFQLSAS